MSSAGNHDNLPHQRVSQEEVATRAYEPSSDPHMELVIAKTQGRIASPGKPDFVRPTYHNAYITNDIGARVPLLGLSIHNEAANNIPLSHNESMAKGHGIPGGGSMRPYYPELWIATEPRVVNGQLQAPGAYYRFTDRGNRTWLVQGVTRGGTPVDVIVPATNELEIKQPFNSPDFETGGEVAGIMLIQSTENNTIRLHGDREHAIDVERVFEEQYTRIGLAPPAYSPEGLPIRAPYAQN